MLRVTVPGDGLEIQAQSIGLDFLDPHLRCCRQATASSIDAVWVISQVFEADMA
jgi:hypothetical protein